MLAPAGRLVIRRLRRFRPPGVAVVLLIGVVLFALWQLTSGIRGTGDVLDGEPTVPSVVLPDIEAVSLDGSWSRIDLPGRSRLRNVWDVGGTLYASGWDSAARTTVVWTSPDGAVWRPITSDDGPFDNATVYDMIGFDGLVIAVGTRLVTDHPLYEEVGVPAVWRSFDGEAFFLVAGLDVGSASPALDSDVFLTGGFTSAHLFGDGLVVGGWEGIASALTGAGDEIPGVWQTEDAVTFTHVANESGSFVGGGIVRDLAVDDDALVAVGVLDGSAAVWTSVDAESWERVVTDSEFGSAAIAATPTSRGALVLGRGVLGEGEDITDALRLWGSSTGSFVRIEPEGLDLALVSDVTVGGFGMVAVGAVPLTDNSTAGAIWASADGLNWTQVQADVMPRESEIHSVIAGERALVAVGEVRGQPSVWVRPTGQVDSLAVGVGSLVIPPAWSTVFQQEEANGSVPAVVLRAGEFLYGLSSARWLWRSLDGDVWTLQEFESVGLADAGRLNQIVASEAGWVATGESDGGAIWFSSDGDQWGRPTIAPPCCAMAAFRIGSGFAVLIPEGSSDQWLRATSADGLVWEVDEEPLELPVATIGHVASIGPIGLLWGESTNGGPTVWQSADMTTWRAISGPDAVFDDIDWTRVWDLGGEVLAAGIHRNDPVLFRTSDGVNWQELSLPNVENQSLAVSDVGGFGDGLAVLLSYDDRPTRLLTFTGIGAQDEIPLDVASGFGGLWSILVPNEVSLRMLGPDHGRTTIWEWIPAP